MDDLQRRVARATAGLAFTLLAAGSLGAQAICSAPHSSPVLAGGGTLGTLDPGAGWIQLSAFSQQSDELFDAEGTSRPLFAGGRATSRSLYLTAATGVARGIDVWAQASLLRVRYADDSGSRERTGLGDFRLAARLGTALVGSDAPVALRAGLKLPGSRFPVDGTVVPLSEGQTDVELSVETGRAFRDGALYAMGWVGHRWRLGRTSAAREPGDEWFVHAALGGRFSTLRWELAAESLHGAPPVNFGIELDNDRRRLFQLTPSLGWSVGPGEIDVGAQIPLAGRNLPADPGLSVGYRLGW